jgi:hypothetical protein
MIEIRLSGLLLILFLLTSCQKSSTTNNPVINPSQLPKSVIFHFPTADPNSEHIYIYSFQTDSIKNTYTVSSYDSLVNPEPGTYLGFTPTVKTYYFSSETPKRITRIEYRLNEQEPGGTPLPHFGHDIDFTYNDNTQDPGSMTITDYLADQTAVRGQVSGDIGKNNTNWQGLKLDIINCDFHDGLRTPNRTAYWNDVFLEQYDDSVEVIDRDIYFYFYSFFNYPDKFPEQQYYTYKYIYVLGKEVPCKTFAIDLLSTHYEGMNVVTDIWGQRKIDYTYSSDLASLEGIFNQLNISSILFWEKSAFRSAGVSQYADSQEIMIHNEMILPDMYLYYADISASYTDSLFQLNDTPPKQLLQAHQYVNNIEKDNSGRIISITRSNESGLVYRKITLNY